MTTTTTTERDVRRRVERLGYRLSKLRGVERYRLLDPEGFRHGGWLVHGGEWGDTLDGIAEWIDAEWIAPLERAD